ncbi:MAG: TIGR01440 family protein [Butyrivibrio sp.]|nr:TIGR01440 family protein [Butyrivibrio sp.]
MGAGISNESFKDIDLIKKEIRAVFNDLYDQAKPEEGDLLVVGCSSSEVASHKLGTFSSEEIGKALVETLYNACKEKGLHMAAQCCEHLNRALILEKEVAQKRGYEIVSVVPKLKAGGSFATAAYKTLPKAVAVEHIKAELGIDIGDTLIGMHLKDVAVPVRVEQTAVGNAHIVCARTRPKYIGGERAVYN